MEVTRIIQFGESTNPSFARDFFYYLCTNEPFVVLAFLDICSKQEAKNKDGYGLSAF